MLVSLLRTPSITRTSRSTRSKSVRFSTHSGGHVAIYPMKAANRRLERRAEVCARLEETGRTLIHLCEAQIAAFAGNAIELQGSGSRLLVLSQTAFDALEPSHKRAIEQSATLVPLTIPTIEMGGGSVRCTIAGIHLARRR